MSLYLTLQKYRKTFHSSKLFEDKKTSSFSSEPHHRRQTLDITVEMILPSSSTKSVAQKSEIPLTGGDRDTLTFE